MIEVTTSEAEDRDPVGQPTERATSLYSGGTDVKLITYEVPKDEAPADESSFAKTAGMILRAAREEGDVLGIGAIDTTDGPSLASSSSLVLPEPKRNFWGKMMDWLHSRSAAPAIGSGKIVPSVGPPPPRASESDAGVDEGRSSTVVLDPMGYLDLFAGVDQATEGVESRTVVAKYPGVDDPLVAELAKQTASNRDKNAPIAPPPDEAEARQSARVVGDGPITVSLVEADGVRGRSVPNLILDEVTGGVELADEVAPHRVPDTVLFPVAQASPTGRWARELLGQIPPPRACLEHPEDAFEDIAVGAARTSEGVGVRKQGMDPLPDLVGHELVAHAFRS